MQFAQSTVRFLSLTALGLVFVCIMRADEKPMMKAVVAHEYGAPEVLEDLSKCRDPNRTETKRLCA